jgi:hypothetical protein
MVTRIGFGSTPASGVVGAALIVGTEVLSPGDIEVVVVSSAAIAIVDALLADFVSELRHPAAASSSSAPTGKRVMRV